MDTLFIVLISSVFKMINKSERRRPRSETNQFILLFKPEWHEGIRVVRFTRYGRY